jgi:hypothetical protein
MIFRFLWNNYLNADYLNGCVALYPEKRVDSASFLSFSREHFFSTLLPTMVLTVSDRVKSSAKLYDAGTEDDLQ